MPGTGLFAFSVLDAVESPAIRGGVNDVIIRVAFQSCLLGVHDGEEVGDGDVLRAAVGAGDQVLAGEDLLVLF